MLLYKLKIPIYLFVIFCCLNFNLMAQVKYVTDSSYVNTVSAEDKKDLKPFTYQRADTAIAHYQNYFPRNTNGNYGLPSVNLYLNYSTSPLGFKLYSLPYQNDLFTDKNVNYYQTKGPYASLTGIAGSKQEQCFKFLFTNTFKNKLNITLAFNRYSGIGFYNRQQTFTNNFYTSSNYTNKKQRFGYYANFIFNKLKHSENGGVSRDTAILENVLINKLLVPINYKNAKRELRNTSIDFNPWFKLNKSADSNAFISHYLSYQFNYKGNYTKFTDVNSAYENHYLITYFDTTTTKDSTHWSSISNAMNYRLQFNSLHTSLQLGASNESNNVHQYYDSGFFNNSVNAVLQTTLKHYSGVLKANYIFSGANQNDMLVEFKNQYSSSIAKRFIKSNLLFNANVSFENRHPDFIYNTWNSNHYSWINHFLPTKKTQALVSVSTEDHRLHAGVLIQNINNYLYFDEQANAQQTSITVQNLAAFIKKDILLFKHLGINVGYNYQSSSYTTIVAVPNQIVNSALYYQGNLFKKALQLQIGFNVQYYSEFYGNAYNVATNNYVVQTKKTVGNYPFVDFFLNARIRPVRFFVKLDHLNQGLTGSNYQLTPGYYQNDRAVKFGINWLFYD